IGLDLTVLLFTLATAVVTGMVFGIAPAIHMREGQFGATLKEGAARTTSGSAQSRVRRGLVVAEVALAVVLVVGAGLMLRSFWNLMQVDTGFKRDRLTTVRVVMPPTTYHR